jgi:hypothetical protein
MPDITQRTLRDLWLPLLLALVLCASVGNSVIWAESQTQEIELESGYAPNSSEDDTLTSGALPLQNVNNLLLARNVAELLSAVSGSDAYPGFILHGPPA